MTIYKKYAKTEYKPFCQHHIFGTKEITPYLCPQKTSRAV